MDCYEKYKNKANLIRSIESFRYSKSSVIFFSSNGIVVSGATVDKIIPIKPEHCDMDNSDKTLPITVLPNKLSAVSKGSTEFNISTPFFMVFSIGFLVTFGGNCRLSSKKFC